MAALPKSTRVLRAYRIAKNTAKEAREVYRGAKHDKRTNRTRLLRFSKIVIGSLADLKAVIGLKAAHDTWKVEVELLRKYRPHGQNRPPVKFLRRRAKEAGITLLPKKVRKVKVECEG